MSKFQPLVEKYSSKGISENNLEYIATSVKAGVRREHIIENLASDYRGMEVAAANEILDDFYQAAGGEFKKENRGGYLFGSFLLFLGLIGAFYIIYGLISRVRLIRPIGISILSLGSLVVGFSLLVKTVKGKYRDSDDPFSVLS